MKTGGSVPPQRGSMNFPETRLARAARAAALAAMTAAAMAAQAQVIDLHTGEEISEPLLAERLRQQDLVLLGELHDNPQHHRLRGELIAHFARPGTTVVAEHLPSGARVAAGGPLQSDLEAAGFDAKGWRWPLHQPLFGDIRAQALPLVGGNLPKGYSKQLMAGGEASLTDALASSYRQAPLAPAAVARLDGDLVDGHCGQLPDKYLAPMRLVQRATDISMANMLLAHAPAVLVAGNGHVRKDYGVPQVLEALAPSLKISSIGFYERGGDRAELIKSLAGRYDYVWLTEGAGRSDPCENFKLK